jgi:hypothetical protein
MTGQIMEILSLLEQPGQPGVIFTALDDLTRSLVGHQLFTLLIVDGDEVARVYSNRPAEYAVSGRKPMGRTPWGDLVLKNQKPYLGRDKPAIRWAFFDHALIESLLAKLAFNVLATVKHVQNLHILVLDAIDNHVLSERDSSHSRPETSDQIAGNGRGVAGAREAARQ